MHPSSTSDDVARNRETLAEARRRVQAKAAPLALGGLFVVRFFRDEPWFAVAYIVILGILSTRWIMGYRRLKAELGLAGEYDELDENAGWGAKTLLIVFGGFAVFFGLLFGLMSVLGNHH